MRLKNPMLTDSLIEASGGQEINYKVRTFGQEADYRFIRKGETVKKAIARLMANQSRKYKKQDAREFPKIGSFNSTVEYFAMYDALNRHSYSDDGLCLPFTNLSDKHYAKNEGKDVIDESHMVKGVL